MYIAMLADRMDIGGAETHVLTLCRTLIRMGHTVYLLSAGGCYADAARANGIHTVYMPSHRRDPISTLRCIWALRRTLKRQKIDIMHAHTRFTSTIAALFGGRTPSVSTAHLPFVRRTVLSKRTHWGKHTLAVSEDIRTYLTDVCHLRQDAVTRTVNGIDPTDFSPSDTRGHAIVHASRMDEDRVLCARLLCRIAPGLAERFPDASIHLIGDGSCMTQLRRSAARANRKIGKPYVRVMGRCADMPSALRKGRLFVGVSRAAQEAMSVGLPVILCGNEGYGGILDEQSLSHAAASNLCARGDGAPTEDRLLADITQLLSDDARCDRLRAFGIQTARTVYSAERMTADALSVYRRVLSPKSVFLIGYFGFGNLGDEASLSLIQLALMKRNIYNIHIFAKKSSEDGQRIHRFSVLSVLRAIRTSDTVLFGGGNLLQNETSRRSLALYTALLSYAHRHGKRILMVSVGIGGLSGKGARRCVGRLLSYADGAFLRTHADLEEAHRLLPDKRTTCTLGMEHDICFTLRTPPAHPCSRRVLFILRPFSDRDTLLAFEMAVDRLRRHGYSVALLVLFRSQDHAFSFRLGHLFSLPVYCADSFTAFAEHTAGASLIVSDRLHGAIFSLLCHIPCLLHDRPLKNRRLIDDLHSIARRLATPSPLLPFSNLRALTRALFRLCATHPRRTHGRLVAAGQAKRARHTSPIHRLLKKEVGGGDASDFVGILQALRVGDSWERCLFYEDAPHTARTPM